MAGEGYAATGRVQPSDFTAGPDGTGSARPSAMPADPELVERVATILRNRALASDRHDPNAADTTACLVVEAVQDWLTAAGWLPSKEAKQLRTLERMASRHAHTYDRDIANSEAAVLELRAQVERLRAREAQRHIDAISEGEAGGGSEATARARIRAAFAEADVTQAELARRLDVSQKHVSQVLSGRAGLSLNMADRMLAALGRGPLIGGTDA